MHFDTYFQQRP